MKLNEMNESYEEYILSEEYLAEGLVFFKESKKLYKFANKLNKKLISAKSKGKSPESIVILQKLVKDVVELADKYKSVEDSFSSKALDRRTATSKLRELKDKNYALSNYVKSERVKESMKILGVGSLIVGISAVLAATFVPPQVINSVGVAIGKGFTDFKGLLSKIPELAGKTVSNVTGNFDSKLSALKDGLAGNVPAAVSKSADLSSFDAFGKSIEGNIKPKGLKFNVPNKISAEDAMKVLGSNPKLVKDSINPVSKLMKRATSKKLGFEYY